MCGRAVSVNGVRTPTSARTCWRRLMVTCISGSTSQSVLAPSYKSRVARNSTMGVHRRPRQ